MDDLVDKGHEVLLTAMWVVMAAAAADPKFDC